MPFLHRLNRGQSSLEYLLLLAVVAVVVIASFSNGSLIDKVHNSSQDYYSTVTNVITGSNPNPIDGGWCPVTCPTGAGPTTIYGACECPAPAFGGQPCSQLSPGTVVCSAGQTCKGQIVSCSGVSSCGTCPAGETCNASGVCSCPTGQTYNGTSCVTACPVNMYFNTTNNTCACDAGAYWNGSGCVYCPEGETYNGTTCVAPNTCNPTTVCPSSNGCSSDSCGNSCGSCPQGQTCSSTTTGTPGTCSACVPTTQCPTSNGCGVDSCGNSCGSCINGQTCNVVSGTVGTCTNNCGTCVVPPNVCGGSPLGTNNCGVCIGTQVFCAPGENCFNNQCIHGICSSIYQCGPQSENGVDSNGDPCTLPEAQCNTPNEIASGDTTCSGGECVCVPLAGSCQSEFQCGPLSQNSSYAFDSCHENCVPAQEGQCTTPPNTTCNGGYCTCTPQAGSCKSEYECGPLSVSPSYAFDSCNDNCTPNQEGQCTTPPDLTCSAGMCINCTPDGSCVTPCGSPVGTVGVDSCDNSCTSTSVGTMCSGGDQTCVAGQCVCSSKAGVCPSNNVCGPDTCGNINGCGTCPVGQTCSGGQCQCVPNCVNAACGGADGCGGTCQFGTCPSGQTCSSGQCVTSCTPNCTNAACGAADGCGGTCPAGTCPSGQTCTSGQCVTNCTPNCSSAACGGADGCGGTCQIGSCPTGESCNAGQCTCNASCGVSVCGPDACGNPNGCGTCPGSETCNSSGQCTTTFQVTITDYASCASCAQVCSQFNLGGSCGKASDCGSSCGISYSSCVQDTTTGGWNCGSCLQETLSSGQGCPNGIAAVISKQTLPGQTYGTCGSNPTPGSATDQYTVICN